MRIYPHLAVELTIQINGSSWLGILRGSTENINLVFNSLFNHGATNSEFEWRDHLQTVATFYTSEEKMRDYMFRYRFFPVCERRVTAKNPASKHPAYNHCMAAANQFVSYLRENCTEMFSIRKQVNNDIYENGKIRAENPDLDFKDSVILDGFVEKNPKELINNRELQVNYETT